MAVLIIFFPVTTAFSTGCAAPSPAGSSSLAPWTPAALAILAQIRVPAALPALASGLRVAAAVAPIGAVVGEWVGSSAGLGYLMLHANARMQIDLMFAAALGAGRRWRWRSVPRRRPAPAPAGPLAARSAVPHFPRR